jgi:hypothetical protein
MNPDFDLVTDVLVGVVLPSNTTGPDVHGTMLQAALAKGYNPVLHQLNLYTTHRFKN